MVTIGRHHVDTITGNIGLSCRHYQKSIVKLVFKQQQHTHTRIIIQFLLLTIDNQRESSLITRYTRSRRERETGFINCDCFLSVSVCFLSSASKEWKTSKLPQYSTVSRRRSRSLSRHRKQLATIEATVAIKSDQIPHSTTLSTIDNNQFKSNHYETRRSSRTMYWKFKETYTLGQFRKLIANQQLDFLLPNLMSLFRSTQTRISVYFTKISRPRTGK